MIIDNIKIFYNSLIINRPLIAIDHGLSKLGFAISDPQLNIAMPLQKFNGRDMDAQILTTMNIINRHNPCGIVIGWPMMMDGTVSQQSSSVQKFAEQLALKTSWPIYMQDERLTTKAADSLLRSMGWNRKERTQCDDSVAASLILETVLANIKTC